MADDSSKPLPEPSEAHGRIDGQPGQPVGRTSDDVPTAGPPFTSHQIRPTRDRHEANDVQKDGQRQQQASNETTKRIDPDRASIVFGTAGTVIALIALAFTVYQAHLSREQMKLSREQMMLSSRAWLVMSADVKPIDNGPVIDVPYVNAGTTPATNVVTSIYGGSVPAGRKPNFAQVTKPQPDAPMSALMRSTASSQVLGPNIPGHLHYDVEKEGGGIARDGSKVFFVFGRIDYDDIFKSHHCTRYCYWFSTTSPAGFIVCPYHNDIDKDEVCNAK